MDKIISTFCSSVRSGLALALFAAATTAGMLPAATVTLDTSPLVSGSTGPYYLDFQFTNGDGVTNNTATLSSFSFGAGGSAVGAPALMGGVTGDTSGAITLTDASFFQLVRAGVHSGRRTFLCCGPHIQLCRPYTGPVLVRDFEQQPI